MTAEPASTRRGFRSLPIATTGGIFNWDNAWIDLEQLTTLPDTINAGTESLSPIYPGYDAYILMAGQSLIYLDGVWHFSASKYYHAYSAAGGVVNDHCHFP